MADKALSGLLLIVAAVFGAYLFYRRLKSEGGQGMAPSTNEAGGPPVLPKVPGTPGPVRSVTGLTPLDRLLTFGAAEGLPTPTERQTTGGRHVTGSLHYQGRAVDFGTRGLSAERIRQVIADAVANGFRVLPELYTGQGKYGPSSGPHLHIEDPYTKLQRIAP